MPRDYNRAPEFMILTLVARPPFNFRSVVHSHGWYQLAPWEWDDAAQTLSRVERLASERVVLLRFRAAGDGLAVETQDRLTLRERGEVERKSAWMFALEADFTAFYTRADTEPRLAHCRAKAHGRLLRSSTMWEDVVKVMMTTNIQWSGTQRLVSALVQRFGEPLPNDPSRRAFPKPETIAHSREATLRKLGLGYRAPYLLKLARGINAGEYDLAALMDPSRPTDELRRELIALPGIGPYAANTLLAILGRYDYIGVDTEAISRVSKYFYDGRPIGEKEINAVFGAWGEYKALAYWFWDYAGMGGDSNG
jgi:3-methyladenine DNA glycosylase/8-oxoguanine DNA glycosylase